MPDVVLSGQDRVQVRNVPVSVGLRLDVVSPDLECRVVLGMCLKDEVPCLSVLVYSA